MRYSLALASLVVCALSVPAGAALSADEAWVAGNYRAAFAAAIEPAIKGDAHAQFLIGEAYRLGRSVDPNLPQAQDWYARAARQGDISAATELGLILVGQHMERAAAPWLTMAAQRGEPRALCALAALYFNGDGVERDELRAYALMVRAARAGLPEAKERLATLRGLLSASAQDAGEALAAAAIPDIALPNAMVTADGAGRVNNDSRPVRRPIRVQVSDARAVRGPARPQVSDADQATVPIRVQVGAFRSAAAAERAWAVLNGRVDGLANVDHVVVRAGRMYRLQAHLPDMQAADPLCHRLREAGWQHFIRRGSLRT